MADLLNKVIWKKKHGAQFLFAGLGFFVGLFLLLVMVQLFWDFETLFSQSFSSRNQRDYLVLNKKVKARLFGGSQSFSERELSDLESQPFVGSIGRVLANHFSVSAYLDFGGSLYSSELFFEAVPEMFLEGDYRDFTWAEESDFLPIIISREFLSLYNFGFATPRRLPLITKDTLGILTLQVVLEGPGGKRVMPGRVVGVSDSIASILVPYPFMEWANKAIALNDQNLPSRIIVQVIDRKDPQIAAYLQEKEYETGKPALRLSELQSIIRLLLAILIFMGLSFMALALVILLMNFQLILSQVKDNVLLLLDLGYHPRSLIWPFTRVMSGFLGLIGLGAVAAAYFSVLKIHGLIMDLGMVEHLSFHFTFFLFPVLFLFLALSLNFFMLNRGIRKAYFQN